MRSKLVAGIVGVVLLGLVACTSDQPGVAPSPSATASPTVTATAAAAAVTTPPLPWQIGEQIHLDVVPYDGATVTEVTAETVLPDRDTLDREGGLFVWERESGRLLFIEGIQYLYLAPGLVDGRPIGIAFTPIGGTGPVRSVIVRLEPFEAVMMPVAANVRTEFFDAAWADPTIARVSLLEPWTVNQRAAPAGEYTLDLATVTLALVQEQRRGSSAAIDVEQTWPQAGGYVSMLMQNGRRALRRGDGGLGEEIAGNVERWELSPDGSKLLMVANRSQLVTYSLALDRRWDLGGPAEYGSVEWSPDGRYIAATVFDSFEQTTRALVFDVRGLDVAEPPDGAFAANGLALPPLQDSWTWRWRGAHELFIGSEGRLSLLNVETGASTTLLDDRQPYDTFAWDESTSTLARSRLGGVPASVLELDEAGGWFDIPLLAASPQVGLFDMNWGAEGQWLALNTAPGRS